MASLTYISMYKLQFNMRINSGDIQEVEGKSTLGVGEVDQECDRRTVLREICK